MTPWVLFVLPAVFVLLAAIMFYLALHIRASGTFFSVVAGCIGVLMLVLATIGAIVASQALEWRWERHKLRPNEVYVQRVYGR